MQTDDGSYSPRSAACKSVTATSIFANCGRYHQVAVNRRCEAFMASALCNCTTAIRFRIASLMIYSSAFDVCRMHRHALYRELVAAVHTSPASCKLATAAQTAQLHWLPSRQCLEFKPTLSAYKAIHALLLPPYLDR